ncbi:tetratricopeptide repeat protein [Azospirillum argentinense]|uniref:tetratricopeptide repeat protein n=1 Tax=Azospirillum argentinense TaxID=2970906 RepID=UPI001FFF1511|nr:tetratricopeptide repeat protein [Azospirillum argentinense]
MAAGRRGGHRSPWEAVLYDPARAEGAFLLGLAAARLGRMEAAIRWFRRAVRLQPGWADVWAALADACRRAGRWKEAAAAFAMVLALSPADGAALVNLAVLERAAGHPRAAVRRLRRALALDPRQAGTWNNLGNALRDLGATAQAAAAWRTALALDPGQADALGNLGGARRDQDRFAEARVLLHRALALAPQHAALHGVLAYALSGEGRLEEAERACRRALALAPALADPLCTLGLTVQRRGGANALRWFDRAATASPGHPLARFNRGLADLESGALAEGWANYSCRFAAGRAGRERRFSIPEWRGEPLAGKRLFIWREQGVGDEFLFASCYADAIRQAGGWSSSASRACCRCSPAPSPRPSSGPSSRSADGRWWRRWTATCTFPRARCRVICAVGWRTSRRGPPGCFPTRRGCWNGGNNWTVSAGTCAWASRGAAS